MQYVFSLSYDQLSIAHRRDLRNAIARLRRALASGIVFSHGKGSWRGCSKAVTHQAVGEIQPHLKKTHTVEIKRVGTAEAVFKILRDAANLEVVLPDNIQFAEKTTRELSPEAKGRMQGAWHYFRDTIKWITDEELHEQAEQIYAQLIANKK
ncbi:putative AraC family transcriptional regulator [Erwinia phage vB_EamM_EarlPhillipIV]|uniref:Putative AraC family transcriptional regulator n=1 Tax=Erwinia phage vB_EamM_EarlPhillipIV TaxID=1883372 RepID=A0A1B2ICP6_9CAUD|nr:putative AraC family transcriptional regulator [Erwinia phage vB_EamM_EarlPhillipIV]ANZ49046.1 putative AraC family transcriptional regulator [Erwinia phage vB_EamM_EarlPhillipIV]